jgi:hypothetical protein
MQKKLLNQTLPKSPANCPEPARPVSPAVKPQESTSEHESLYDDITVPEEKKQRLKEEREVQSQLR